MATQDYGSPIGAFLRGFQGVRDRQQKAQQDALNEELKQLQIAQAQAQLNQLLKTPQQRAVDELNERLAIAAAAPESGIALRPSASQPILAPVDNVAGFGNIPVPQPQALPEGAVPVSDLFTSNPNVRDAASASKLAQDIKRIQAEATARTAAKGPELREVGNKLLRVPETGAPEVIFTAPPKVDFKYEFVKNTENPKDIRYLPINPETGTPPEGFTFVKSGDSGMKPSESLAAQREVRTVYDELPAKIDYFGKGQVPGSNQLKTRLDAVLKPVNNDFSKLNPQAKQTFVFAINKLRDPTSATLLAEANQIAARAGIGDRFGAFIENYKSGDPLPNQVAKEIYDVISQVHSEHRENLIQSLIPISGDIESLGKKLTAIGVPSDIQKEVEARIESGQTEPTVPRGTNPSNPTAPITIKSIRKKQ